MTNNSGKTAQARHDRRTQALLDAQFELQEAKKHAVLVVIAGSDGAGKGAVANRLYDRLDAHYVETLYYGAPSEDERLRPPFWRYWRDLPAKGRIGLVLGGWHHAPLLDRATGEMDEDEFKTALADINSFEQMLIAEGVALVKIWLAADEKKARKRLEALREEDGALRRPVVVEWDEIDTKKERKRLAKAGLEMAEASVGGAPWTVIPADDENQRDEAAALRRVAGWTPLRQLRELARAVQSDACIELDTKRYSVLWRLIGATVTVLAGGDGIVVSHAGAEVARHEARRGGSEWAIRPKLSTASSAPEAGRGRSPPRCHRSCRSRWPNMNACSEAPGDG